MVSVLNFLQNAIINSVFYCYLFNVIQSVDNHILVFRASIGASFEKEPIVLVCDQVLSVDIAIGVDELV